MNFVIVLLLLYLFECSSVERTMDGEIFEGENSSFYEKRYPRGNLNKPKNRLSEIEAMRQKLRKLYSEYPMLGLRPNKAYQKMMSEQSTFYYKISFKPNGLFGIEKKIMNRAN